MKTTTQSVREAWPQMSLEERLLWALRNWQYISVHPDTLAEYKGFIPRSFAKKWSLELITYDDGVYSFKGEPKLVTFNDRWAKAPAKTVEGGPKDGAKTVSTRPV
jgi:hypothetical protein